METTHILIHGDDAYNLANDFSDFTLNLSIFALICYEKEGKTKQDYQTAFESLQYSYTSLLEARKIPQWVLKPANVLLEQIALVMNGKINDDNLMKTYDLVIDFLTKEMFSESPDCFKHRFLASAISGNAKEYYTEEFFSVISNPLEVEDYDAAVLAAFKYLDEHLRKLVGIDSHQFFGEDLINKVFSLNSGVLQVNTHPNEQIGLRNWFSGANAVFRNPIAHRFENLDEKSALSAIAMVALMIKMATELSNKRTKTDSS